jgi:hypothetical protein
VQREFWVNQVSEEKAKWVLGKIQRKHSTTFAALMSNQSSGERRNVELNNLKQNELISEPRTQFKLC